MEAVIGFALGILVVGIILFIFRSRLFKASQDQTEEVSKLVEMQLKGALPEILRESNEQLVIMANEKLGSEKKEIKTDMESKRGEIERLVKTIEKELRESQKVLSEAEKNRIGSFHALREKLEEQQKITEQLRVSTEGLKKVLSNNQLRGQFGEKVAEDLMKMAGFVKGVDYDFNKKQEGSGTRPDFTVFLPDGTRINVDAKFPYSNLQRLTESDNEDERARLLKQFETDVKEKVRQVSTRDYINVDDNTVDFVILFIPNEMIFSFIYENLSDVWQDAMSKKVILAGPFSFTAILRMVRQAYDNFRYQSNIRKIVDHIKNFEKQFMVYNEEFVKIGSQIQKLEKQYQKVDTTRTNQLNRSMDKVLQEGIADEENEAQKLLE